MNILRPLILTIIGILLLMTLWPLFIMMILAIVVYWIILRSKIATIQKEVQQQQAQSPDPLPKGVIEAEYTERRD